MARDEVIFGGKVKELAQLRDTNQQLQVKLLLSRVWLLRFKGHIQTLLYYASMPA